MLAPRPEATRGGVGIAVAVGVLGGLGIVGVGVVAAIGVVVAVAVGGDASPGIAALGGW